MERFQTEMMMMEEEKSRYKIKWRKESGEVGVGERLRRERDWHVQ